MLWRVIGVSMLGPLSCAGRSDVLCSLGEYAALVTAGVLSLEDGLKIVAGRANLMAEKCTPNETGMLAVKMSPVELASLLTQNVDYDQLSVACYNRYVALFHVNVFKN